MPLALAILFAFLLEPLATGLERFRFGRVFSAFAAVLIAIMTVGALAYFVLDQFGDFGKELPKYEATIHQKLRAFEARDGWVVSHAMESVQDFRKDLTPTNSIISTNADRTRAGNTVEVKAVPVEVRNPDTSTLEFLRNLIGPSVNVAAKLFLVTIFCIFILIGRDDLRSRLARIVGARNALVTNRLLKDTGQRLSRYLLMQLIVNVSYGIPIGLGMWALGIPNPLLCGMFAALFRYIPYAGACMAALIAFAIAFAIDPGWGKPALVLVLFGTVEILTANFLEPWLYGNSVGITPLAILLAAVFWSWLWGPIGLLLSIPLTVCLVSISRFVPQLEILDQLFGKTRD